MSFWTGKVYGHWPRQEAQGGAVRRFLKWTELQTDGSSWIQAPVISQVFPVCQELSQGLWEPPE